MQQPNSSNTLMTCIRVVRRSGDRIPVGDEIFRIHSDQSLRLTQLLVHRVLCLLPGDKGAGTWRLPPTSSTAQVKER